MTRNLQVLSSIVFLAICVTSGYGFNSVCQYRLAQALVRKANYTMPVFIGNKAQLKQLGDQWIKSAKENCPGASQGTFSTLGICEGAAEYDAIVSAHCVGKAPAYVACISLICDATPPPPPSFNGSGSDFNTSGFSTFPGSGCGGAGGCEGSGEAGPAAADPVAVFSGAQLIDRTDMQFDAGTWVLNLKPHFTSKFNSHTSQGFGWNSVLTTRMFMAALNEFYVRNPKGQLDVFMDEYGDSPYPHVMKIKDGAKQKVTLTSHSQTGPFEYFDGAVSYYYGIDGALDSISDNNGFGFQFHYDMNGAEKLLAPIVGISTSAKPANFKGIVSRDYRVTSIKSLKHPGYVINVSYNVAGYVDSIWNHQGIGIKYLYDTDSTLQVGRLVRVRGLEGQFVYEYATPQKPFWLTNWNSEPFIGDVSTNVAQNSNIWSNDGRVTSQTTGSRTHEWKITKDDSKSVDRYPYQCEERRFEMEQKIYGQGMIPFTETFVDTIANCVESFWDGVEVPDRWIEGIQWSTVNGKKVYYGPGQVASGRTPFPFVRYKLYGSIKEAIWRDSQGQDTLNREIDFLGRFKDTVFTHRKYGKYNLVSRETRGKRFDVASSNQHLNDSITISTDYDSKDRFWREVQWKNAADSSLGSVILRQKTYNADGSIATETELGVTTIYDYSQSSFPGKASKKVMDGQVTQLFTYDALGRIATETDPRSGVTKKWYTASGRDSITISPADDTTFSYWEGGRLIRKIENRKGAETGRDILTKYDMDGLDTATYVLEGDVPKLIARKKRDAFGRIIEEGDSLNKKRKGITFDILGREIGDTVWSNQTTPLITRKYLDQEGRDTALVQPNGDSVHYRLDAWGNKIASRRFVKTNLAQLVEVSADSSIYGHDNQVLARYDSLSPSIWQKTSFQYDKFGNLKRSIGSRLDTTLNGYDLYGKKRWSRDPNGKYTWFVRDSKGFDSLEITILGSRIPDTTASYTLQAGDLVKFTKHDNAGNLRRIHQGIWQSNFNSADLLPLIRATGYYPSNRVQADSVPVDIANQKWLLTTYEWNPTGELRKFTRTGGMENRYLYNARGQKIAELALNAQGTLDTTRTYSYDAAGRLVEERTPGMGGSLRTYDEANRVISVIDSSGVRTGLKLDALGRVVADTNGLGYVANYVYEPNAVTHFDRKNAKTLVTRDALGRTNSINDNEGNMTQFAYTIMPDGSQRDLVSYPDGTWEATVTDKGGRTIQKLDKRGVTQSFVYGNDWALNTVRYEMATKPTLEVVYTRNAKGQVEKVERIEGGATTAKTEYTYDEAGRVLSQKQTVGGDIKTTSYAYDMALRSVTVSLDGTTRTKVLDERGRLDGVYLDGAMVADYLYDNNKHIGTVLGNSIHAIYDRNVSGRLTSMAYGKFGQDPILRHDLDWDVAGQLKWTKKTPDAIADERYGMDNNGQLTEWKIGVLDASNEIPTPVDSLGWKLDSRGNWDNVFDSKATVDTRVHSEANAINARNGTTFVYDDAGNLLSDGAKTYEWTLDGMLAKVTSAVGIITLQYDGMRRLVKRTELDAYGAVKSTTSMLYDGWQLAQEVRTTSTNTETRTYTYGRYIDDVVAVHVDGGSTPGTYYYHQGYNHDVETITNATGAVVERYGVKPYGEFSVSTDGADGVPGTADDSHYTQSTIGNNIVFQGRPFDAASGLYDFRNRQYSAALGRFISRDPAGMFANKGFNLYQAFDENPLMFLDPWGLTDIKVHESSKGSEKYWGRAIPFDPTFAYDCNKDGNCKYKMTGSVELPEVAWVDINNDFTYYGRHCKRTKFNMQMTFMHEKMHVDSWINKAKSLGSGMNGSFSSLEDCQKAGRAKLTKALLDWSDFLWREEQHINGSSPGTYQYGRTNEDEFKDSYAEGLCDE